MNEELLRLLTLFLGSPMQWMFTTVLSLHEFIMYNLEYYNFTKQLNLDFIMIRAFCILSHFSYLFIQLTGWVLYKKTNKRRYIIISYFTAVFLHVLWNTELAPNLI